MKCSKVDMKQKDFFLFLIDAEFYFEHEIVQFVTIFYIKLIYYWQNKFVVC